MCLHDLSPVDTLKARQLCSQAPVARPSARVTDPELPMVTLAELTADGTSTSEAVRRALVDAVQLRRREEMLLDARVVGPRATRNAAFKVGEIRHAQTPRLQLPTTKNDNSQLGVERFGGWRLEVGCLS